VTTFDTAIGACAIAWSDRGICGVSLPERDATATESHLLRAHPGAEPGPPDPPLGEVIDRIGCLLDGTPDPLADVELDLSAVSEFARRVYAVARNVGPGQTTTYGEIATQLGSPQAAREVGQALGHNPVPILVPCHRVLGAGGKLVGFSAPGGVQTKLAMLAIEGAAAPDGQTVLF
jgi:methylated-DNA-[protein]-cysteine S-methyltransferase